MTLPPGPSHRSGLENLFAMSRDPTGFLLDLATRYGVVSSWKHGMMRAYLVNEPELIREVLVVQQRKFVKAPGFEFVKKLTGNGLLVSEGDFHLRQRRLAQPAFHKPRIAGYAATMVEAAEAFPDARGWKEGERRDLHHEMMALTLEIVAKTLFGAEIGPEVDEIGQAMDQAMRLFRVWLIPLAPVLDYLPLPQVFRFKRAKARLDETIARIVAARRKEGTDRGDLLSMLILATDSEGDGTGMSDEQLVSEAMTLFLAGHETTANALAWTWFLLSRSPEVEGRILDELANVLGGHRLPSAEDFPRLVYTRQVFSEALRLYPPAWNVGRRAVEEVQLGRWTIPAGSLVFVSPWVTHHDPRFFPDPFRFDPDRFAPDRMESIPKLAYFPFGAGTRICIGEGFAWMEGVLLLASLARRWRVAVDPVADIRPHAFITLRPDPGVPATLHSRFRAGVSEARPARFG